MGTPSRVRKTGDRLATAAGAMRFIVGIGECASDEAIG
jgi:hypothetical protein